MLVEVFLILVILVTSLLTMAIPAMIGITTPITPSSRAMTILSNLLFAGTFFCIYYFNVFTCTYQTLFNIIILGMCTAHIISIIHTFITYKQTEMEYTFRTAIISIVINMIVIFGLAICLTV